MEAIRVPDNSDSEETSVETTMPTIEEVTMEVLEDSQEDTTDPQTDLDSAKATKSPFFNIFVRGNLNINLPGSTGE